MPNYYRDNLANAMLQQWAGHPHHPLLVNATFEHDGPRYWWVYDRDGRVVSNWECRPFPGNNALVVTTQIELRADLRGRGLGKFLHELRRKAYAAAGFKGELCTVRSDSEAQTAIVAGSGAVCVATLPSDFGGQFNVWMLPLNVTTQVPAVPAPNTNTCGARRPYTNTAFCDQPSGHTGYHCNHEEGFNWPPDPLPNPAPNYRVGIQSRVHTDDYAGYQLDRTPTVPPVRNGRVKKFAHRTPKV